MASSLAEERVRLRAVLPTVIGHRGAALVAPENTLAGIRTARAQGATWIEVDVKLSRDGVPFLLHDDRVDRTTDGRGAASDLDWTSLAGLDAGSWFGPAFAGEPLPRLDAVIELLVEEGMGANLEIKPSPGREAETGREIASQVRKLWHEDEAPPLFSSFKPQALAAAAEVAPEIPRGLLLERLEPGWSGLMDRLGCASLHLDHRRLRPEDLRRLAASGLPVLCYTVNEPGRAQALERDGATSIITDAPGRVLAALKAQ